MAKKHKKQKNIYDVLMSIIDIPKTKISSPIGQINLTFGIVFLLIVALLAVNPIVYYILKIIQTICNAILTWLNQDILPINAPETSTDIIIWCLVLSIVESISCNAMVYISEKSKKSAIKKK